MDRRVARGEAERVSDVVVVTPDAPRTMDWIGFVPFRTRTIQHLAAPHV